MKKILKIVKYASMNNMNFCFIWIKMIRFSFVTQVNYHQLKIEINEKDYKRSAKNLN